MSLKKILKSRFVQEFICRLAWAYIWLVYYTTRWKIEGLEEIKKLNDANKPFIYVFWHGRLLMIAPFSPVKRKLNVVISTHNDGRLISRVMEHFGFHIISGSSNKSDGVAAFKDVLKALKNEEIVTITPDGPRGPRMRIGGNVIKIAQMTGVPIIPVTYSISRCKILRSWDRFMLAMPFARGVFIYGAPIMPCANKDKDALQEAGINLENKLNELTRRADEIVGINPVEPQ